MAWSRHVFVFCPNQSSVRLDRTSRRCPVKADDGPSPGTIATAGLNKQPRRACGQETMHVYYIWRQARASISGILIEFITFPG